MTRSLPLAALDGEHLRGDALGDGVLLARLGEAVDALLVRRDLGLGEVAPELLDDGRGLGPVLGLAPRIKPIDDRLWGCKTRTGPISGDQG